MPRQLNAERLDRQMGFLLAVDELKTVLRRTYLAAADRFENDAEHSWHLALVLLVLAEYADQPVDLARAVKMALVHDLVEIDAGDTYCYDVEGYKDKAEREEKAAARIFGLLPADQGQELKELWQEFERGDSPEAKFAAAADRLQPLLLNLSTKGRSWQENGIRRSQVAARIAPVALASQALWQYLDSQLDRAVADGLLGEG